MTDKKRKILEFTGSMLTSLLVFLVIYKFIPIVYSTNDDRMISEIISGQFTGRPESYAIQMSYGFTWFLSKLYEITRSFNWYGIVLIGAQIFSFGAILYRLQSFSDKWTGKLLLTAAAIAGFVAVWLNVYVQMTYTTTAAFVGLAAIFWYAASKSSWKNILMVVFLANLAFCIRPNVFYMFVPATGLAYLWKLIGKKDFKKQTIAAPFLVLAVTLSLLVTDAAAYSKEGWKEFKEFFDDRTDIYDFYDLADYEEHKELYEPYGISEEEYNMIRVYNYTVLGDLPKEFFPEYLEAYQEMEKEQGVTFVAKAADAAGTFLSDLFSNAYGFRNTGLFLLAVILLGIFIWKKNYPLAIYLSVQTAVMCIVWMYFTYWSRAIERIQMTMSFIMLAVILHVLCEMKDMHIFENGLWKKGVLSVSLAGIAVLAVMNFSSARYDNLAKAKRYSDIQTIKEYCAKDPDRLYYMDVATMTELYGRFTIKNTEPEYINYIALGDWSAYCPHYEEKLVNHGVKNIAESITGENTYVIMLHNYQLQCMKDYLDVTEAWEETIFGVDENYYAVYQFSKNE